ILRFRNAKATILGDLFTVQDAQVIVDSSYLYFPQEYFYQRNILLTGNSSMKVHNSTLDFGGLVHTMATVDAASLELINVKKPDFSTVGMYGSSSITIDSIDMAGEFVIDKNVNLNIKHAKTVLLWHSFRDGANVNISFPDGDQVDSYTFNNSTPGVSGVNYSISINSCKNVMWGMMPMNGSEVTVSNSDIRSIGMQFRGSDSASVSGLVNNNQYENFTAPLTDRYFHLNNCNVTTWSIYTFDSVIVDVKGCILGEIGVMGRSEVNAFQTYIDGSGGYFFATDTTFSVIGFSSLTSSLRSSSNSMVIFAYSTMMNGLVQALQNSILMLLQSSITVDPAFDPGSVVWMANIASPASGVVNSDVKIIGSAWIDKGSESNLMDFDHYAMFYQKTSDTTTWYPIGTQQETEIRNGVLLTWDTHNVEPGAYFIKLDLTDNWGNTMTALKTITVLPEILGTGDELHAKSELKVFPSPFTDRINVEVKGFDIEQMDFSIYDSRGKVVFSTKMPVTLSGEASFGIDGSGFSPGVYYYRSKVGEKVFSGKIVKM
ncbi:MAG: T9SS type A sorting domain-containing protein, partial [Chlorobi bacterium]|nr:T9SS type A sorting domain-containing protein [Chlorobiota bacterium]